MNFIRKYLKSIRNNIFFHLFKRKDIQKEIPFLLETDKPENLYTTEKYFRYFELRYIGDVFKHKRVFFEDDITNIDLEYDYTITTILNEIHNHLRQLLSEGDDYTQKGGSWYAISKFPNDVVLIFIDFDEAAKICIHLNIWDLTNQWLEYKDKAGLPVFIGDNAEVKEIVSYKLRNAIQSQKTKLEDYRRSVFY